MLVSILIFLIMFGVIVVSHEFGHYAIARRNGIHVVEFDVGMGPLLWKTRRGETDFCVRLLPLGGACVFDAPDALADAGTAEDARPASDGIPYPKAPVLSRIATILAGPMANFILGFILAFLIVALDGTDLPVVMQVMDGSAAQEAGIEAGDVITRIDRSRVHLYRDVSLASMMNYGEPMTITYLRDGEKHTVTLSPRYDEAAGRYYIGLLGSGEFHRCGPLEVFPYAFYEAGYWFHATWRSLGTIFSGHFRPDDLTGPVGVVKVVDDTYQEVSPYGLSAVLLTFMNLATLLTINLGVMNLLPLPALDGGKLVLLLVEAVRGRPIPPEKEGLINLAGVMMLIALMVLVMFNDIARFFH